MGDLNQDGLINVQDIILTINITSFGLDQNSELLICANANIYKLISDEEP